MSDLHPHNLMPLSSSPIKAFPRLMSVFGLGIGTATNPYFGKLDYLWIMMHPHLLAGGVRSQLNDQSCNKPASVEGVCPE